jgi:hypothetical protein
MVLQVPVLLIVDGHYSHTKNLDVVDNAREHSVATVSLPQHSKHKMQPLDVSFMKPLKTYYAQVTETWLVSNPSRVVASFVVCKLFGVACRRAATKEASINSFIKTGLFPCNRSIFQDHKFECHGMTNLKTNVLMELAMKFQDQEHRTFLSKTPVVRNLEVQQTSTPSSSNSNMFCFHRSSKTIKSDLCKLLTAKQLRECQEKKVLSLSKKPAIKRLFGKKIKKSSQKHKVGIQESSRESHMAIKFESDDAGVDISDGEAQCLFCAGLSTHNKNGEKLAQCVRCIRWVQQDYGLEEHYFVCPMYRKSVKL